jgi:transcriptional regulator with XRE-family HTH domain
MTLDEYLSSARDRSGLTETQFAQLVGASQSYINRLRRNECLPSFTLAKRIRVATGGQVTASDFEGAEVA